MQAWGPKAVRSDIWVGMRKNSLKRKADVNDSDKKLQAIVVETAVHASGEDVTPEDLEQLGVSRARYLLLTSYRDQVYFSKVMFHISNIQRRMLCP